jgi:hypothetical protein
MKPFGRLQRLWAVVKRQSGNKYVQGRAAQIAGGALIADGIIGLENPLGRKSRMGIVQAVMMMAVGLGWLFVFSSTSTASMPYENGEIASGVLVEVSPPDIASDSSICYGIVEYSVDGITYRVRTGSSSICGSRNISLDVSYPLDAPGRGRVVPSAAQGALLNSFSLIPTIFFVIGATTFLVRGFTICAGIYIFLRGRKLVNSNPEVPLGDIKDQLIAAWGAPEPSKSQASVPVVVIGDPGPSQSPMAQAATPQAALGVLFGKLFGGQKPTHSGPPPGMYDDPDGQGKRWWDGARWTEHAQDHPSSPPTAPTVAPVPSAPPSPPIWQEGPPPVPLPTPPVASPRVREPLDPNAGWHIQPDSGMPQPPPPQGGTQAGWYPDPDGEGTRWWDGTRWTDRTEG